MKVNNPSPALTRLIAKRLARKVAHTRKMKSKIINKPAKKQEAKKAEAIPEKKTILVKPKEIIKAPEQKKHKEPV